MKLLSGDTCGVGFSQRACAKWVEDNKKIEGGNGKEFANNYATKGCHFYPTGAKYGDLTDHVYYGTGGTEEQMAAPVPSGQKRPTGYGGYGCEGIFPHTPQWNFIN